MTWQGPILEQGLPGRLTYRVLKSTEGGGHEYDGDLQRQRFDFPSGMPRLSLDFKDQIVKLKVVEDKSDPDSEQKTDAKQKTDARSSPPDGVEFQLKWVDCYYKVLIDSQYFFTLERVEQPLELLSKEEKEETFQRRISEFLETAFQTKERYEN